MTRLRVGHVPPVIEAYGNGEIELEQVDGQGSGYQYLLPGGREIFLATVARFLGWITGRAPSGRYA